MQLEKCKKDCMIMLRDYSDIKQQIVWIFSEHLKSGHLLRGRDKFQIEMMNWLLGCLTIELMKKTKSS